jgi:ABC-type Fe3+ transport system substrate-binding protein
MSCEYPIQLWQLSGRVYQRAQEDATLDLGVAWPDEGVVLMGVPMAILKGSKHPNAAKLLMEFLLSEEGMNAFVTGEGVFSLREGFQVPAAVKKYTPDLGTVKVMPVNWATFTIPEVRRVQNDFRKILRVD